VHLNQGQISGAGVPDMTALWLIYLLLYCKGHAVNAADETLSCCKMCMLAQTQELGALHCAA
jgi:hypothetical protein